MKRGGRSLVIDDCIVRRGLGLRESPFCAPQAGMQQLREFALLRNALMLRGADQAVVGWMLMDGRRVDDAILCRFCFGPVSRLSHGRGGWQHAPGMEAVATPSGDVHAYGVVVAGVVARPPRLPAN